jgi:addiction module HigA family antidote
MVPNAITANRLAIELRVPASRISEIVRGERSITAETAMRLAAYFQTSAQLWLGLQSDYDLEVAEAASGEQVRRDIPQPLAARSVTD